MPRSGTPRTTSVNARRMETLLRDLATALKDPAVQQGFRDLQALVRPVLAGGFIDPANEERWGALWEFVVARAFSVAPDLKLWLGEYTPDFFQKLLALQLGVPPESVGLFRTAVFEKLDSPIRVLGHDTYHIPPDTTQDHLLELGAYLSTLRPARPKGPPPGIRAPKKPSSRLDPDDAALAYDLSRRATKHQGVWRVIALRLWPRCNPHDLRQAEGLRKRVGRLVYRGEQLARSQGD